VYLLLRLNSELGVVQRLYGLLARHADRLLRSSAYMGDKTGAIQRRLMIIASSSAQPDHLANQTSPMIAATAAASHKNRLSIRHTV